MVVLIASHRSALLLYCLPPSYNSIFITDHRFLIGFRTELHVGHSFIFSPVNFSCSKNSQVSLDIWKGTLSCLNTHYTFETGRLGLASGIVSLVHRIAIVSTVQFDSFIDFEWSNNCLVVNSSLYYHTTILLPSFDTGMSGLYKIHPFAHQSGPSNVTHDASAKIIFKKSIFIYLLLNFDAFMTGNS